MAAEPLRKSASKSKVRRIDTKRRPKSPLSHEDLLAHYLRARTARMITAIAIIIFVAWFLVFIFQPGPSYELTDGQSVPIGTENYMRMLEALADAHFDQHGTVEVFPNGENFYPVELEAIRNAKRSVNFEAYIFQKGKIAQQFVDALADRARAGVKVNVVLDAVGSMGTRKSYLQPVIDAGGKVEWYNPLRWNHWIHFNNRTHRELLVVDGEVALAGGAGVADHWLYGKKNKKRWRDDFFRFRGDTVVAFQGSFAENWVEASGQVLNGTEYFPGVQPQGDTPVMV